MTLHDGAENRTSGRQPGQCYCKPTLRSIGRAHGEGHLAICLRLINETGNGLELHAATLQAISALVLSGWVTVGSDLFDTFDGIDLGRVRAFAKTMPGTTADTMAALLLGLVKGQRIARDDAPFPDEMREAAICEIEIDGVGTFRLPNEWQSARIRRVRKADRPVARMAFGCGMTVQQFRKLPQDRRQAVWQAYLALTSPGIAAGVSSSNDNQPPPRFRKGLHRGAGEKIAIGRRLIGVKASLPRGHFGPWLEEQGIPAHFAHQVMKMAAEKMKHAA